MPSRRLTVRMPRKKASCSARLLGLRLAHSWLFSTSTSSSMSRMVSGPLRRVRPRNLRRGRGFTSEEGRVRPPASLFMGRGEEGKSAGDAAEYLAQVARLHQREGEAAPAVLAFHGACEVAEVGGRDVGERVRPVFEHGLVD